MKNLELENEILTSVKPLNGNQKSDLPTYIRGIKPKAYSTNIHRKKAMKQIRRALENQF